MRVPRGIVVRGEPVAVSMRVSARARRLRIVVAGPAAIEVVVPRRATGAAVERFLTASLPWLERALLAERPALALERRGSVCVGGAFVPVELRSGGSPRAELRGGVLEVAGGEEAASGAIERWYRREARARLETAADREAARLGLAYTAIAVRDQRTRWGSCSPRGALSFSWRLLVAPPDVLRYVVVHELCHLRELNHSRAFWALVDAALPGWREQGAWLRAHGGELRRYRPATALV
jgi:predicted metal-dependent hydrolase